MKLKSHAVRQRLATVGRAAVMRKLVQVPPRDDLIVIGDLVYGGYRLPVNGLNSDSIVYSIGVGEDIRFDLGLIARFGCTIHALDPVPRAAQFAGSAAAHEPRFIFHQLAAWSRDEMLTFHAPRQASYISHSAVNLFGTDATFTAQGRSLGSLMAEWGHDHVDLVKISAEGAEFEILDSLLNDGPRVSILCAEFSYAPIRRARTMLGNIAAGGYDLVSAHIGTGNWTFTWLDA